MFAPFLRSGKIGGRLWRNEIGISIEIDRSFGSPKAARALRSDGSSWHLADNPTAPRVSAIGVTTGKVRFWPGTVCPLMTQSGLGVIKSGQYRAVT
jgi:hypothetical protein